MAPAAKTKRKTGSKGKQRRVSASAKKAQDVARSDVFTYVEGRPSPWLKGESDSVNGND